MNCHHTRPLQIDQFLADAGWEDAEFEWLGQDASTRRYARLSQGDERAILMDAPPVESGICTPDMSVSERQETGWNAMTRLAASRVDAFVLIAHYLREIGLRPPEIFAHKSDIGLALIEDFGEGLEFARLIERGAEDEVSLYKRAAEDLAFLHNQTQPNMISHGGETWPILEFDRIALEASADLYADWFHLYDDRARMNDADRVRWEAARDELIDRADAFPRAFTLRDYHAENLLWLPEGRIGLLDFQDAVMGWDAWDMAMLTQDARRPVSDEASDAAINTYLELTGKDYSSFIERLSIIGVLNALRIVGIFSRLITQDGKPRYTEFMPRQQALLAKNLSHPAASDMRRFIAETAPFLLDIDL
ncbi:MAG: phosphotransferase [Pseudomonadota bacterium]